MIISKKSLMPFMAIGSIASGCCLYWQYHSNIDLSVVNKRSVVGFMVANPTSGSQLKIQYRNGVVAPTKNVPVVKNVAPIIPASVQLPSVPQISLSNAKPTVSTNVPLTVGNDSKLNSNNSLNIKTDPVTPVTTKGSPAPLPKTQPATLTVTLPLTIPTTPSTPTQLNAANTKPQKTVVPQPNTLNKVSNRVLKTVSGTSADLNPCDSSDCYVTQVVPILMNFIEEKLNDAQLEQQITEKIKTNTDTQFRQKVEDRIASAKNYITLKREIEETAKQIDKIQNTNSILGDELSSEAVKETEQIAKIQQKTAEVNAIKFTPTSLTCAVGRRTTAATNHTTYLQTCLGQAIKDLEIKQKRLGLTPQEKNHLQTFKYNFNVLKRKAQGNAEIQNMKNHLIGIKKTITTKSNMIAANKVKVQSNEDKKTLALRKQEQIKIELNT